MIKSVIKRKFLSFCVVFLTLSCFLCPPSVFAKSNYVLPYPSSMPGSMLYKISLLKEQILKYWYYGNFGQFSYNLKQSDKYLVEAKTLFEYNQYLLAKKALGKSDYFFQNIEKYLLNAKKEHESIADKAQMLKQAALKHIEVLENIEQNSPKVVNWIPEKDKTTIISIHELIENSKKIRQKYL